MKEDKELAIAAIKNKVQAIEFISKDLLSDFEVISETAKLDGEFAL